MVVFLVICWERASDSGRHCKICKNNYAQSAAQTGRTVPPTKIVASNAVVNVSVYLFVGYLFVYLFASLFAAPDNEAARCQTIAWQWPVYFLVLVVAIALHGPSFGIL